MMISPETYIGMHEDASFKQLIKERNQLLREIRRLEKIVFSEDRSADDWRIKPGPDVRYQMELEYLAQLCLMMRNKYNRFLHERMEWKSGSFSHLRYRRHKKSTCVGAFLVFCHHSG